MAGVLGIPNDYRPGEKRAAVIFCQGFTGVKEMWLPDNAERLEAEGYITLVFDYRFFGESGGEPRSRLIPSEQVTDIRNAITFLENQPEVNPDRVGLYGTSFGACMVAYTAGIDARVKCTVAAVGPGDCERQFRLGPGFDAFVDKVRRAKAEFVLTGKASYLPTARLMGRDPDVAKNVENMRKDFPNWKGEISFESLLDIVDFKPESVVERIAPRAIMFIHAAKDKLVPLYEAQSLFAKARPPKKLVVLEDMVHYDIYKWRDLFGRGFEQVVENSNAWFKEHMPAR